MKGKLCLTLLVVICDDGSVDQGRKMNIVELDFSKDFEMAL